MDEFCWTVIMKRVMCLRLLNWPVQRQQRRLPADQHLRIAIHTALPADSAAKARHSDADNDLKFVRHLFSAARSSPAVICVSDDTWAAGIRPGMPLAEARSMATPLTGGRSKQTVASVETLFLEWSPAADRQELRAVAELVRRFAPIIGMDEMPVPDSLLLDITGCAPLFGGEAALAEQLLKRLRLNNLRARAAISDTVATAWAFAHADGHFLQAATTDRSSRRHSVQYSSSEWELPVVVIPPGQSETWLHPLPIAAGRIPLADAGILFQLGILTLKQLFHLPFEDLPSRISAEAVRRLRQVRGLDEELITSIPEADPVSATWASEFPATSTNEIRQILEHLVTDIAEQLQRRCLGAIRLNGRLKPESGEIIPLVGEMVKPVQSTKELTDVLLLRLESLRLPPVLSVTVHATVAPLPMARQQDLFSPSEHIEPTEELAAVVNRLSSRLGKQSVLTAEITTSPVPESSIRLRSVIQGSSDSLAAGEADNRLRDLVTPEHRVLCIESAFNSPLRLLPVAVALGNADTNPLTNGFHWNGASHVVIGVIGPERIETQWWHEAAIHRDYYRVTTRSGSTFWIYADLANGDWYLHGVFD